MPSDSKRARFEREVLPHLDAGYNLARWILKGSDDAQDVTQEAMLRAFRYFDGFHGDNAKAWLLKIVRNCCHSWLSRGPKTNSMTTDDEGGVNLEQEQVVEAVEPGLPRPDARLTEEIDRQSLQDGIEALPSAYREILVLREMERLSYQQISEVVEVPLGMVMSRLSRARALLLERLSAHVAGRQEALR